MEQQDSGKFEWGNYVPEQETSSTTDEQQTTEDSSVINWDDSFDPQINEAPKKASAENNEDGTYMDFGVKNAFIGALPKLQVFVNVWKLDFDNKKALQDIDLKNLPKMHREELGFDGKYEIQPPPADGSEFYNLVESIREISYTQNMDIYKHWLFHNKPGESVNNNHKRNNRAQWIYILKANKDSGKILLDFTHVGGPLVNTVQPTDGLLLMIPGWVPYSISRNESIEDFIAIGGTSH